MEQEAYPQGRWRSRVTPSQPGATLTLPAQERHIQCRPDSVYTFFVAPFPDAEHVHLIGDFTHWDEAPIELQRGRDGCWFTSVPLSAGCYAYAYLVDGVWMLDATAPKAHDDSSAFSNIVRVLHHPE